MRRFLWGFLIGAVLAFLAGVNVGKDKPILSNPFADRPLSEQVRETAGEVAERAREGAEAAAERAGEVLDDAQRAGSEAAADIKRTAEQAADKARGTVVGEPAGADPASSSGEAKPQQ